MTSVCRDLDRRTCFTAVAVSVIASDCVGPRRNSRTSADIFVRGNADDRGNVQPAPIGGRLQAQVLLLLLQIMMMMMSVTSHTVTRERAVSHSVCTIT